MRWSTPRAARRIAFAIAAAARVAVRDHGEAAQAEQVARRRRCPGRGACADAAPPAGSAARRACRASSPRSPRAARRAARSTAPSSTFSVMFPVKPSVTKTSTVPSSSSRPSALPAKSRPSALAEQLVRLERELVALLGLLADREQADARLLDAEDLLGEDGAHVGELEQVLGPVVGVRAGVDQDGDARRASGAGRRSRAASRPAARRMWSRPAASIAPVFPAETTASALAVADRADGGDERRVRLRAHGLGGLVGHLDPVGRDRRARARPCRDRPGRTARRRCRRRQPRARLRPPRRERGPRRARRQRSAGSRLYGARSGAARPRGPCRCRRSGRRGGAAWASCTAGRGSPGRPRSRAWRAACRAGIWRFSSSGLP